MYMSTQAPVAVTTGTTSLVAAGVAGGNGTIAPRIRVVAAYLVATGAQAINFQSHTTTTIKTGAASVAANAILVLPYNEDGWFTTVPGEGLDLVTTGTTNGSINYVQI